MNKPNSDRDMPCACRPGMWCSRHNQCVREGQAKASEAAKGTIKSIVWAGEAARVARRR